MAECIRGRASDRMGGGVDSDQWDNESGDGEGRNVPRDGRRVVHEKLFVRLLHG